MSSGGIELRKSVFDSDPTRPNQNNTDHADFAKNTPGCASANPDIPNAGGSVSGSACQNDRDMDSPSSPQTDSNETPPPTLTLPGCPTATNASSPSTDSTGPVTSIASGSPLIHDDRTPRKHLQSQHNSGFEHVEGMQKTSGESEDVSSVPVSLQESPAQDETDKTSIFSYYMDKDFRYYFQHPYLRLLIPYLVTFCNFLLYAEDPVAHSEMECFIPVVGNCFSFVCTRYPTSAWSLIKVLLWLSAILVGLLVGKLFVHKYLLYKLAKLKMFTEDQGSWVIMFFTTILTLFIFSWVYNLFLLAGGDSMERYRISSKMGIKNSWFMKAAACGTWCGDFFTAWMVTDIMLQEKLYPHWAKPVRKWWNRSYNRIILFWMVTILTCTVVILVISTDWIKWDKLNRDFVPSSELSRSFLASSILVMDFLIVMQDWDFPHFMNNFDIKLPGVNASLIKFSIPRFLRRENWVVHITGKWFNYGIIFIVMLLDLNMWKNQIFYDPPDYGQYVSDNGKIHTVKDMYSLEEHNDTELTYDYRVNTTNPATNKTYIMGDTVMNSRYLEYDLSVKAIAFIPCLFTFVLFGILIWYFGRWKPTEADPHGGRLKRRDKKRASWLFRKFHSKKRKPPPANLERVVYHKDTGGPAVIFDGNSCTNDAKVKRTYPENWEP